MIPSAARSMAWRKGKQRRRLDAPEPLEEVLERAGENRFARRQLPMSLARWRATVGPRIADRARPIALERGILIVKVATSVWANELTMLAPQIIAKLAKPSDSGAPGIEVKGLRFRVGPLDVIEGIPQRRDYRQIPPPAPLAPELARTLEKVEDTELRAMIERAARANLAWQTAPRPRTKTTSGAPPSARAPRAAGTETSPRARTDEDSAEGTQGTPGDDSGRRR